MTNHHLMTKIPGKWKDAKEGQFIILRKLMDGDKLASSSFEAPRTKINISDILEEDRESLPHSSALKRLSELIEEGSIEAAKKNGKKTYQITFYGFIKLLSLSHGRGFFPDIMEKITEYFFLLKDEFEFLIPVFTREQLFDTFTTICNNTKIEIFFDVRNRGKNSKPNYGVPGSVFLRGIEWAHQYYIEINVRQLESTYLLRRHTTIYGKKEEMVKKTMEVHNVIYGIIVSAFFFELLMRCQRFDEESREYNHNSELVGIIINRIGGNKILLPSYLEFVKHLESKHMAEGKVMFELKNSLSKVKIPRLAKPLIKKTQDNYDKFWRY